MTLIEAIKSGRPYRRPHWGSGVYHTADTLQTYFLKDVTANDWETLEPTVTITRAQFWEAVTAERHARMQLDEMQPFLAGIARRLGLGD